jgi:predicted RNA-binding Zn ribbon-like protein
MVTVEPCPRPVKPFFSARGPNDKKMNFEFVAGNLALDFTNLVHNHGSKAPGKDPEKDPEDDLKTFSDLTAWCHQAGLLSHGQCRQLKKRKSALASADFRRAVALRESLYEVFSRIALGQIVRPEALRRLNGHFREAMAAASLRSAGKRFEMTWDDRGAPLQRVWGAITRSAVSLLTSDRLRRVRQCAGENCTWLFLDTSRNGMRRWCDMQACGNRFKVQRFRKRNAG